MVRDMLFQPRPLSIRFKKIYNAKILLHRYCKTNAILVESLKVYEMIQLHPQVALATGSSACKGFLAWALRG